MRLGALSLPGRYRRSVEAVAEAGDEATGDELAEGERGALHDLADHKENQSHHDRSPTPKEIAPEDGDHGRDKAADVPCSSRYALDRCGMEVVRVADSVDLRELLAEGGDGEDASEVALIVSEKTVSISTGSGCV